MKSNSLVALAAGVALMVGASGALAAPVQWTVGAGGNDHWYEFVTPATTWTAARTAALGSTHLGMGGYLATLTSAGEQSFLLGLSADGWLGGSDAAVEGQWRWMDGPESSQLFWSGGIGGTPTGFTSWNGNEPNNQGDEDYLHLNGGRWNDLPSSSTRGYFVEYSANGVPLPGTLGLAAAALAALALVRRRKA